MAFSSTTLILVLLVAASTTAHSFTLGGNLIAQVAVLGRLVCTVDGNPGLGLSDPPLSGVNVTLSCNGGETSLGQALTDTNGFYQIILNTADGVAFDQSSCAVFVPLPVGNCTLLPPTGSLRGPGIFLNIVPGVLGLVAWFYTGLFEIVHHA